MLLVYGYGPRFTKSCMTYDQSLVVWFVHNLQLVLSSTTLCVVVALIEFYVTFSNYSALFRYVFCGKGSDSIRHTRRSAETCQ